MTPRTAMLTALIVLGALLALVLAAPFTAPFGTFVDLDGTPASVDHGWQGRGVAGAVYLLGDIACHQEMSRSFVLNGSQLPICIRDLGILAGAAAGCAATVPLVGRLEGRRVFAAGLVLTLVTGAEWIMEGTVGDMPRLRFMSGIVTGIGASVLLGWWATESYRRLMMPDCKG